MIRRRKKNKRAGAKMNDVKKETYKEPVKKVYACCPFCSATLLQAECVKNRCFHFKSLLLLSYFAFRRKAELSENGAAVKDKEKSLRENHLTEIHKQQFFPLTANRYRINFPDERKI